MRTQAVVILERLVNPRIVRQLVVVPFVLISALFLGVLIAFVFTIETFIGEAYEGPYKFYLVSTLPNVAE